MISRWLAGGSSATQSQPGLPQQLNEKCNEARQSSEDDNRSITSIDTIAQAYDEPDIKIHLLASGDGAIVSVIPPSQPHPGVISSGHVPVDIVLVIDVSASMSDAAPAPQAASDSTGTREDFGLSVLDLTKHAARTIMETLNEDDRLSIVTFSTKANVLQPLTNMTTEAKDSTERNIAGMEPEATTNMWQGIMYGLDQFTDGTTDCGRVPAIMVLTDGMPNFGDPPKGYVAKLRDMAPLPATIHTFGFGYQLDACLFKAVAEVGGGNFSFISDAGMIGTVFIHAVAHLQSTHATKCTLEIKTPLFVKMATIHGKMINGTTLTQDSSYTTDTHHVVRLNLGNLQYGQSRDIYLECRNRTNSKWTFNQAVAAAKKADSNFDSKKALLSVDLNFSFMRSNVHTARREKVFVRPPTGPCGDDLSQAIVAYHKSRAMLCDFLMSFFLPDPYAGFTLSVACRSRDPSNAYFKWLLDNLPARQLLNNATSSSSQEITEDERSLLESLLQDLEGQIAIALTPGKNFLQTWAVPYFASLSHAHFRQLCNSFKDPGPLKYNDNAFFRQCRDTLDKAFDQIEPPTPSRARQQHPLAPRYPNGGGFLATGSPAGGPFPAYPYSSYGSSSPAPEYASLQRTVNMSLYNDCNAGCFAAETLVQLASSCTPEARVEAGRVPISEIREGACVLTPLGPRKVRYVLRTDVLDAPLCRVRMGSLGDDGGVLVTPWHPICVSPKPSGLLAPAVDGGEDGYSRVVPTGWVFPAHFVADQAVRGEKEARETRYTGSVYTLMLEPDNNPAAHAILLSSSDNLNDKSPDDERIWGVTLGHGLIDASTDDNETAPTLSPALEKENADKQKDVRAHAFFGSYTATEQALLGLLQPDQDPAMTEGVVSCSGMLRDSKTGLVTGFMPL